LRRYGTLRRLRRRRRVTVNEKLVKVDGYKKWLFAAIEIKSKLLLGLNVFSCHGSDPMAAFLYRLTENYDNSETEFFGSAGGYRTARPRYDLAGHLNYKAQNHIENWFQTVT
jgi:putative transposase